jgi:hypothetical protein
VAVHRTIAILLLCVLCAGPVQSPIPSEVKFRARYVNPQRKPAEFTSAMFWGIAIADTRASGYERAMVEITHTELTCRVDGKDVVLNDHTGNVRGGLYRRYPWFGTDAHEPMPIQYLWDRRAVTLEVGTRPDRVWHFWAASPRRTIPAGRLEGCTVKVLARISPGALLQVGFDYWRDDTVEYGSGGNNHEAGASDWYLPSDEWQTAEFTDISDRR